MLIDYYIILGIHKSASAEEIKKAYRQQAKQFHPDVSSDALATAKFQLLNEAYHVLINNRKKRIYDYKLRNQINFNRSRVKSYSSQPYSYYNHYTRPKYYSSGKSKEYKDDAYKKKILDKILFYSLLVIGFIGILFGIFDIFYKEWMGLDNFNGIFFSMCFTFLLIYGWRLLGKKDG